MPSKRDNVPAELRRRVLVEAGHRCAIPTCRHIDVDVHHIVPWESCKRHDYRNLIVLCPNCHRRAGKGEIDRKSLRIYKANLRFTHDRFSQLEVDILFETYRLKGEPFIWPSYLDMLVKRIMEAGYINALQWEYIWWRGAYLVPQTLVITPKGREFIESLGVPWKNGMPDE